MEPGAALPELNIRLLRPCPGHHVPPPARKGRRHGRWVTSGRLPGWSDTVDVEAFRDRRVGHPVLPCRDDAWHDLGREPAAAAHVLATLTLGDECRARSLANHLPLRLGDDRENVGDHAADRRGRVEAKVQGHDLPALVLRGPAAMRAATWTTDLRTQKSVLAAQQAKAGVTLASGRQSS